MGNNVVKKEKIRESKWELLRIICMLFIVLGHFIGQSGFFTYVEGSSRYIGMFLGSGSRIAVNIFLFLGIWFMIDREFNARRITKIYFNTWIFSCILGLAVLVMGFHPSLKYVISGIFPFIGKNLWFVSSYIALILVSPWLDKILKLERSSLKRLIIVLFILINVFVTVWSFNTIDNKWIDMFVWFSFAYIFIGYYKMYLKDEICDKRIVLGIGIIVYLTIVYFPLVFKMVFGENVLYKLINNICINFQNDIISIPNFIIAMCVFHYFRHMKMNNNKYINYIATGAFSTYVIHQTQAFYPILWHDILKCDYWLQTKYSILYCVIGTFLIYAVCLFVETIRSNYIEYHILNSKMVCKIEKVINDFYSRI